MSTSSPAGRTKRRLTARLACAQYRNAAGVVNMGNGPIYHGSDNPSGVPAAG